MLTEFTTFPKDATFAMHALFLTVLGLIFTLVMGSFFLYHVYLVTWVRVVDFLNQIIDSIPPALIRQPSRVCHPFFC